jgi:hypothetical protein
MAERRFPIRLGSRSKPLLLLFGVRTSNAYVEVNGELRASFGFFGMRTPIENIRRWRIEGPWSWFTAIGVRRGIIKGDVTFGGNHRSGVRLDFKKPVRWNIFRPPALYVTVADPEAFTAVLAERGIPGEDARRA